MSESQLRLRLVSNNTKTTENPVIMSSNKSSTNTIINSNTNHNLDKNCLLNDCSVDEQIDEQVIDDNEQTGSYIKKFSKNDRQELVDLLYSEEVIKFVRNKTNNDLSGSDAENDQIMTNDNDLRPLLETKKKNKRRKVGQKFSKSSLLVTDVDSDDEDVKYDESLLSISFQIFIPFLIAGFGTVGAGLVLDWVQHWDVFKQVSEVFILVPALLGLKGNLEMTLASRLSTQANLGHMNCPREQWLMASGNIALIQCQATIVGFLAAVFAITMDWLPEGQFNFNHALLLCASSLLTASIASFLLGLIMIAVVIISHKCNINPDNVATPIAASLGDLTTLALLAQFSSILFYTVDTTPWLCATVMAVFLMLIPVWCFIAKNNKYTKVVLYNGWTPVISAMAISSIGGCILDFAVSRFKGIAVFQPVINGVGGNLVAVQASRISTYLHRSSKLGNLPKSDAKLCFNPCSAFFGKNIHARTARILLLMVIPGHLIFTYGIRLLKAGHTSVTPHFLIVYLLAAFLQVVLLLYFAHTMILWMWKKAIDPDNSAIPYLTALGDLLGTALLAVAFLVLFTIGDKDSDVGD